MVKLERIKAELNHKEFSDGYFLRLHFITEGYLRRFLFIGLRLNSVQYEDANEAISRFHKPIDQFIDLIWKLAGFDHKAIKKKYPDYTQLLEIYTGFCSKFRNLRVHGTYSELTDETLLKCLILSDKYFVNKIEEILKKERNISVYNKPQAWGAKPGKSDTMERIFRRLNLGGVKSIKISKKHVIATLTLLKIASFPDEK